jgi:hypothetical protein
LDGYAKQPGHTAIKPTALRLKTITYPGSPLRIVSPLFIVGTLNLFRLLWVTFAPRSSPLDLANFCASRTIELASATASDRLFPAALAGNPVAKFWQAVLNALAMVFAQFEFAAARRAAILARPISPFLELNTANHACDQHA